MTTKIKCTSCTQEYSDLPAMLADEGECIGETEYRGVNFVWVNCKCRSTLVLRRNPLTGEVQQHGSR